MIVRKSGHTSALQPVRCTVHTRTALHTTTLHTTPLHYTTTLLHHYYTTHALTSVNDGIIVARSHPILSTWIMDAGSTLPPNMSESECSTWHITTASGLPILEAMAFDRDAITRSLEDASPENTQRMKGI